MENLMNSEHKATNELYRKGYDRIFKKSKGRKISEMETGYTQPTWGTQPGANHGR